MRLSKPTPQLRLRGIGVHGNRAQGFGLGVKAASYGVPWPGEDSRDSNASPRSLHIS